MILNELDLAATCPAIDHRRARCNPEDELLVERAANGSSREFADQRLGRAEDASARTTDVLPIDEKAGVAAGNLSQGVVDRVEHVRCLWSTGRFDGGTLG